MIAEHGMVYEIFCHDALIVRTQVRAEAVRAWIAQVNAFSGANKFPCRLLVDGDRVPRVPPAPPGKWWASKDGMHKVTQLGERGVSFDRAQKYWWDILRNQTMQEANHGWQDQEV